MSYCLMVGRRSIDVCPKRVVWLDLWMRDWTGRSLPSRMVRRLRLMDVSLYKGLMNLPCIVTLIDPVLSDLIAADPAV